MTLLEKIVFADIFNLRIFTNRRSSKLIWVSAKSSNKAKMKVKSLSHVQLFATLWTVAHQAPLSMGFSGQEYWSGLLFPSPGDLPDPEIELVSSASLALAGRFFFFFTTVPPRNPYIGL